MESTHTPAAKTKTSNHGRGAAVSSSDLARVNSARESVRSILGVPYLQEKLTVGAAGDPSEQEADRVADEVMRTSDTPITTSPMYDSGHSTVGAGPMAADKPHIQRVGTAGEQELPSVQQEEEAREEPAAIGPGFDLPTDTAAAIHSIRGGGSELPNSLRQFFEPRFGHDFSAVRVHTSAQADKVARSIQSKAFTIGQDVVFAQGQYEPEGLSGRRLLAHELTHVVQQRAAGNSVQRQQAGETTEQPRGMDFWYSVTVDREMTADEFLVAFVMQYHHVGADVATGLIASRHWHWTGTPQPVSAEDVSHGYKLVHVRDVTLTPATEEETREHRRYYGRLPASEREAITQETDRRFWERTQYRQGERLGRSSDDRRMAGYWMALRDELIQQRHAIESLPRAIRELILDESGRTLRPGEYAAVLRVAEKLMQMNESERQAYLARTTTRTDSLDEFEVAVDRYLAEVQQRRTASLERERTKASLLGMDAVYREYRDYISMLGGSARLSAMGMASPQAVGTSLGMQPTLNRMREELTAHLEPHGYHSIGEFETAIHAFETAFRDEAVLIGRDMLDRYEHTLWTQQERYRDITASRSLHQALTPARGHFQQAHRIREEHASMPMTPGEMEEQSYWVGQFQGQMREGESQVAAQAGAHPLLGNTDIPAERLALASEGEVPGIMQEYILERRQDVRTTRQNLTTTPELVWDLDTLVQKAMVEQDIRPNSIYHQIIQDHIHDRSIERAIINLAIAVFAIAAGIASMGTGTVAVLGAAGAFGIGALQTWEEFRRYEVQTAAHGAQLTTDDPSFAWVVVALVGSGLDLAGVAAALRPMRSAIEAFNLAEDAGALSRLETEMARLRRIGEINAQLEETVVRAGRAESEAKEAWRAARARLSGRVMAVIDPLVTPLLNLAVNFAYPVYLSLRRGIIGLERFLLTREAVSLIGDFHQLSPAQLARVRGAYQIAFDNVQQVAAHAHGLGMMDTEIEQFLRLWNQHPDLSAEEMMRQMSQWAAPLQARAGARTRIAPDMVMDPSTRALLPDFEHQIAGTGGIESIVARTAPEEGRLAVTIEGEILPNRLTRRAADVTPSRRRAPDFNRSSSLFTPAEAGLGPDWQRLHLWGPGFGDEAAAGMMWGPRNINLRWQNDSIESYIRDLAELSQRHGGRTRVRATAISWETPTPGGWVAPQGEHFLKQAEYEITLIRPGQPNQTIRVTLEVAEPPATAIRSFAIDPPSAINIGDLF